MPEGRDARAKTGRLEIPTGSKTGNAAWLKILPEQITAESEALKSLGEADAETIARTFRRGCAGSVESLLETLAGLGMAEMTDAGRYAT